MAGFHRRIIISRIILVIYVLTFVASTGAAGMAGQMVKTRPSISLKKGTRGEVPCVINRRVNIVNWYKGPSELLVTMNIYTGTGRSGPCYEEGRCNITDDYSLVIHDVQITDESDYKCQMQDYLLRRSFENKTTVHVFSLPESTNPIVEQCGGYASRQTCTLWTATSVLLTCAFNFYYPNITLYFRHNNKKMKILAQEKWNNTDGTKNQSITTQAEPNQNPYICVVADVPERGPDYLDSQYFIFVRINTVEVTTQYENYTFPSYDMPTRNHLQCSCDETVWRLTVALLTILCFGSLFWKKAYMLVRRKLGPIDYESIDTKEVEKIVLRVMKRHCWTIIDSTYMKGSEFTWLRDSYEMIVDENREVMFDTFNMIMDWVWAQTCSEDEKRLKLKRAMNSDYVRGESQKIEWMCNSELKQIVKYFTLPTANELLEKLGESFALDDDPFDVLCKWQKYGGPRYPKKQREALMSTLDHTKYCVAVITDIELENVCGNIREDQIETLRERLGFMSSGGSKDELMRDLRAWRENYDDVKGCMVLRNQLHCVLRDIGLSGYVLPIVRLTRNVYKVECAILAERLFMQEIEAFAGALGNDQTKLPAYRKEFSHTSLTKGTYVLMIEFLRSMEKSHTCHISERIEFSNALRNVGFIRVSQKCLIGEPRTYESCKETIRKVLDDMTDTDVRKVGTLLQSKELLDISEAINEESFETARQQIVTWIDEWKKESDEINLGGSSGHMIPDTEEKRALHRKLNDELVEKGFFDLAKAIIELEQLVIPERYNAQQIHLF